MLLAYFTTIKIPPFMFITYYNIKIITSELVLSQDRKLYILLPLIWDHTHYDLFILFPRYEYQQLNVQSFYLSILYVSIQTLLVHHSCWYNKLLTQLWSSDIYWSSNFMHLCALYLINFSTFASSSFDIKLSFNSVGQNFYFFC